MDDDLEALVEKPSIDDSDECLNVRIYLIQVLFIFLVFYVLIYSQNTNFKNEKINS
ncbi:hypothetical protein PFHG_01587 [Plasmodium falciparum HB3]|uniref:Transmembrane protein n=1 Tax=Plasmodium falciparum (isolate HB3) TaxID=137071 RepID=A0A0L7KAC8_PLAFX|nr:hypothetical protein PFHG_01587 [Plasmodium falciparum HB3]